MAVPPFPSRTDRPSLARAGDIPPLPFGRSSILAAGGGDGGEEVLHGGVVVGEDDPAGAEVDRLEVVGAERPRLEQLVVLEELGVVVAAAEVVELDRLLGGDHDERLAQAGPRV